VRNIEWRLSYNVAGANALLEACRLAPGELDRRGWEWSFLKGLTHADVVALDDPRRVYRFRRVQP
jgi:hypothetical protein